jgi:hypothetical protein
VDTVSGGVTRKRPFCSRPTELDLVLLLFSNNPILWAPTVTGRIAQRRALCAAVQGRQKTAAANRHGAGHGRRSDRRAHPTVQLEGRARAALGRVCGVGALTEANKKPRQDGAKWIVGGTPHKGAEGIAESMASIGTLVAIHSASADSTSYLMSWTRRRKGWLVRLANTLSVWV